jgi:AcrR family transcriptional regulator
MNRKQTYIVERVLSGADELAASVRLVTPEELLFRPAPTEWHIHEIVAHLLQTHRDRFAPCIALALREPGTAISAFDSVAHMAAHYQSSDTLAGMLSKFRAECRRIAALVESAKPAAMANTLAHPRMGNVSAEWWALHAYGHTHTHIAQILDNRCEWLRVSAKR